MKEICNTCRKILEEIRDGNCILGKTPQDVVNGVRGMVQKKIDSADIFYLIGMTAVGEKMLGYFQKHHKKVYIVDKFLEEGVYKSTEVVGLPRRMKCNELAVICSRENLAEYALGVEQAGGKYIFFNQLFLWDSRVCIETSQFHTYTYVSEKIEEIYHYPLEYLEILGQLEDEESQELMAKILLYRLFFDVSLAYGVKSGGVHYFDKDIISLSDKEVFVDVGGFDGDTLRDFLKLTGGKFERYYLFEPEEELYQKASSVSADARIQYELKACYDQNTELQFNTEGSATQGRVDDNGMKKISAVRLDDFITEPPSFIKMDIEGSEMKALEGARKIIRKYYPTLAICIYHRPDDIRRIVGFIIEAGYRKLYIRAGENTLDYEMIVYALA